MNILYSHSSIEIFLFCCVKKSTSISTSRKYKICRSFKYCNKNVEKSKFKKKMFFNITNFNVNELTRHNWTNVFRQNFRTLSKKQSKITIHYIACHFWCENSNVKLNSNNVSKTLWVKRRSKHFLISWNVLNIDRLKVSSLYNHSREQARFDRQKDKNLWEIEKFDSRKSCWLVTSSFFKFHWNFWKQNFVVFHCVKQIIIYVLTLVIELTKSSKYSHDVWIDQTQFDNCIF